MPTLTGPAEHLVRRGTELAARGQLADAAAAYRRAAALHRKARRRNDEARTLTLLAACRRLAGDLAGAAEAVERARRLAGDTPAALPAAVEAAEVALARGDAAAAAALLTEVIDRDGDGPSRWRLLRSRGLAAMAAGDAAGVDRDLAGAARELREAGDAAAAATLQVERVTALHGLGDGDRFAAALRQARDEIDPTALPGAAGELDLAEGAAAVAAGRLDDAERLARSARERALAATAPVLYVGATAALAELADLRGDRVEAYRTLATGWATLGDLLGRDGAAEVFRPRMQALEEAWGADEFAAVRATYEDRRRRDLGR